MALPTWSRSPQRLKSRSPAPLPRARLLPAGSAAAVPPRGSRPAQPSRRAHHLPASGRRPSLRWGPHGRVPVRRLSRRGGFKSCPVSDGFPDGPPAPPAPGPMGTTPQLQPAAASHRPPPAGAPRPSPGVRPAAAAPPAALPPRARTHSRARWPKVYRATWLATSTMRLMYGSWRCRAARLMSCPWPTGPRAAAAAIFPPDRPQPRLRQPL